MDLLHFNTKFDPFPSFNYNNFQEQNIRISTYIKLNKIKCVYCIHTNHALAPTGQQKHLIYSSETPTFYQNYLAVRNIVDGKGGKSIAV
jgi:hypothetical protein